MEMAQSHRVSGLASPYYWTYSHQLQCGPDWPDPNLTFAAVAESFVRPASLTKPWIASTGFSSSLEIKVTFFTSILLVGYPLN